MLNLPIVIYGFGGLGRELLGWLKCDLRQNYFSRFVCFVDDNAPEFGEYAGFPVLTPEEAVRKYGKVYYLLAIAKSVIREKVVSTLSPEYWVPLSYIFCDVPVGLNVNLGVGVLVLPRCSLSSDVSIGDFVLLNGGTGVGHDSIVDEYVTCLGGCSINGNVHVEKHALLGANCLIHPNTTIGESAIVGIGSVVLRNVRANETVFGNPAKKFR